MIEIEFYKLLDELKTNTYKSFCTKMGTLFYTNGEKFYGYFLDNVTISYTQEEFMGIIPVEFKEKLFKNKFENEVNK